MGADRIEPFQVVLTDLRERLRSGVLGPGERIAASEVAEGLHLSATPVREALSRLAGEGLLEDRRGQGFFVRTLTGGDIADLYRLSLGPQTIAHHPHRRAVQRPAALGGLRVIVITDPIREVERLFSDWVFASGSRALSAAHRTLQIQLGPVRRIEFWLIDDLVDEAEGLRELAGPQGLSGRQAALRRFHAKADCTGGSIGRSTQPPTRRPRRIAAIPGCRGE